MGGGIPVGIMTRQLAG